MHGQAAEVKKATFDDEEAFEHWRLMLQEDLHAGWRVLYRRDSQQGGMLQVRCRCRLIEVQFGRMHRLQQFVCNRTGRPQCRAQGKRANWSKGYVRLNRTCTSFCHARTFSKLVSFSIN